MNWLNHTKDATAVQWGIVIGVSLAAALIDLRMRRIPNRLTMPIAFLGLVIAFGAGSWQSLGTAAVAWIVLALSYVVLSLLTGSRAGDAKMMGAIGTWLGLGTGLVVLVTVAVVGGLMGLARMAMDRQQDSRIGNFLASLYVITVALAGGRQGWMRLVPPEPGAPGPTASRRGTIVYGPAIFIGVCIAAGVRHSWRL